MRTKAKAESAALHAGLRKEQMKVESLERTLQQKVTHLPHASLPALPAAPLTALSILLMPEVSSGFLVRRCFVGLVFGVFFSLLGGFLCFVGLVWIFLAEWVLQALPACRDVGWGWVAADLCSSGV